MLATIRAFTILLAALASFGCKSIERNSSVIRTPLQKIFDTASKLNKSFICSEGYVMIGEGLTVYPTKKQAKVERYETAALLVFDRSMKANEDLSDIQKVSFCGEVNLQKECWQPETAGTFCVPFAKPIHDYVTRFEAVTD